MGRAHLASRTPLGGGHFQRTADLRHESPVSRGTHGTYYGLYVYMIVYAFQRRAGVLDVKRARGSAPSAVAFRQDEESSCCGWTRAVVARTPRGVLSLGCMRARPLAVKAAGTSLAIAMSSARALSGSPSPADLLAPQALCERYTDETYTTMRDDEMRTRAYLSAIERHAPGKLCLDVGTGALALLAIIAARAGAEHVFAIEANAEAAATARQTVAAEGLEAQITIIEGYSTDVTLPRRVDLLLHEIIGEIASAEGVVAAVLDAGERHLRSGAAAPVSIPARARTLLAPCEFPGSEYFDALPHPMLAAPGAQVRRPSPPRSAPRSMRGPPASPLPRHAPHAPHAHPYLGPFPHLRLHALRRCSSCPAYHAA